MLAQSIEMSSLLFEVIAFETRIECVCSTNIEMTAIYILLICCRKSVYVIKVWHIWKKVFLLVRLLSLWKFTGE